jgi:hypothetical protein
MFLNTDFMLPRITEVIFINKTFFLIEAKVTEFHLMGIIAKPNPPNLGNAILLPMDGKLMFHYRTLFASSFGRRNAVVFLGVKPKTGKRDTL